MVDIFVILSLKFKPFDKYVHIVIGQVCKTKRFNMNFSVRFSFKYFHHCLSDQTSITPPMPRRTDYKCVCRYHYFHFSDYHSLPCPQVWPFNTAINTFAFSRCWTTRSKLSSGRN